MGSLFKTLFGGAPKADTSAIDDTNADKDKAKKSRAALFRTEGGAAGEEVTSTKQRNNLFGN